jgi:hypothetical protein
MHSSPAAHKRADLFQEDLFFIRTIFVIKPSRSHIAGR